MSKRVVLIQNRRKNKKLNVPEDGLCNVMCDRKTSSLSAMTFHPVVKDAGATIVSVKPVQTSSGASRDEWRSAIQNEMQSPREHDVYQEVAEEERWTTPSDKFIPRAFSPSSVEAQRRFGLSVAENFKRTLVLQSDRKCERHNCQSGHADCRSVCKVLDKNRCRNCFSPHISGR